MVAFEEKNQSRGGEGLAFLDKTSACRQVLKGGASADFGNRCSLELLGCLSRSSLGFKYSIILTSGQATFDSGRAFSQLHP